MTPPTTEPTPRTEKDLQVDWESNPRWTGVRRDYSPPDVQRLRGTVPIEYTLAQRGSRRLWNLFQTETHVPALGCLTGQQAVQMAKAGLKAIYLSGWQVAADNNGSGQTYPDQSLYPSNSVPQLVKRLNNALLRADQIHYAEGKNDIADWMLPIIADAEAGFGGPLHAYELTKSMIEAGAAAVHFEDQLAAEKKCGHMGGRVLVPTQHHVRTLNAARLAADVAGVPTLIIARTDAATSKLLTSDIDPRDRPFLTGERTSDGYFRVEGGLDAAIARGNAYAPYSDLLWYETNEPDLEQAATFAKAIHAKHPGKLLAYNCSSSFNWKKDLDDATIQRFQPELAKMGYKFQFITLAGFHVLAQSAFELSRDYARDGLPAYVRLQEREISMEPQGYTAHRHQREVGAGYFDEIAKILSGGQTSTLALKDSTEKAQFNGNGHGKPSPNVVVRSSGRAHAKPRPAKPV